MKIKRVKVIGLNFFLQKILTEMKISSILLLIIENNLKQKRKKENR